MQWDRGISYFYKPVTSREKNKKTPHHPRDIERGMGKNLRNTENVGSLRFRSPCGC